MEGSRARLIAKELQLARSILAHPLYFHGTSMEPLLVEGDGVAIEAVAWDEIRPGDIITYRFEDKFPTRRVVAKRSDRLLLVCDNWPMARFETPREDVLGRALGRLRAGSWLWSTDPDWRQARRAALSRCRPGLARRALGPLRRLVAGLGGGASGAPMAQ